MTNPKKKSSKLTPAKPKAKSNKLGMADVDFQKPAPRSQATREFERNEKRGPGRPVGKRSNPAYRQFTVLLRDQTHTAAIEKLRKITAKPDFGEYVETLIVKDLAQG